MYKRQRLACVCQGVDSLFDVDTVMNITHKVSQITGAHYGESHSKDVSLRVITDHIRSATFMICDGVLPSNEGRGYVLRRLLRRAARHGKLLGVDPVSYTHLNGQGQTLRAWDSLSHIADYCSGQAIEGRRDAPDHIVSMGKWWEQLSSETVENF